MQSKTIAAAAAAAAAALLLASSVGLAAGQTPSAALPVSPCIQNRNSGPDGAGARPKTLEEYIGRVKVIVVGQVRSVENYPLGNRQFGVGTIDVAQVLKGSGPIQTVAAVAPDFGGTFVMSAGQRYVLFLGDLSQAQGQATPDRPNVQRFDIQSAFCVEPGGNVYSSTRGRIGVAAAALDPIMKPLDGIALDEVIKIVRAAIGAAGKP